MKRVTLTAAIAFLALANPAWPKGATDIAQAVTDRSRPNDDTKWDAVRKPAGVLAFVKVRPGEIVGEYLPGGGYYTRLLSDMVGPSGKVFALETTTWGQQNIDATKSAIRALGNVSLDLAPLGTFHLPVKVDLFWTTDNYHDLHIPKYAHIDMAKFNRLVYDSLKPGGEYFILDHAAKAGTGASLSPKLHRIDEKTVIDEVTSAGFKLVAESNLLRNSKDDHSKVVFDPSIRFKTDQFMLLFRRP